MKTSKFQIILLAVFGVFMALGILTFALFKGGQTAPAPVITMWGTIDKSIVEPFLNDTAGKADSASFSQILYVQKNAETMYSQYVEALIAGRAPDILLMPQEELLKYRGKIITIPYSNYSETDYTSQFIQEAELYQTSAGILAIPFTVDPLVMYWNKDIFSNALIASPPKTWEEVLSLASLLTKRDASGNIVRSAVGLGEYSNVNHAKAIMSLLLMQAGTPITYRSGSKIHSSLGGTTESGASPGEQSLLFFTQFADPSKQVYSWNRSLLPTKNYFASNKLGIYFGLASEYREIYNLNPNLNFDVAVVPQIRQKTAATPVSITYGKMYGLSLAQDSKNVGAALGTINYLVSKPSLSIWTQQTGLPSVRRDSLGLTASNAAASVFSISSLWSRAWIDPDALRTATIFKNMIEGVTSGRLSAQEALDTANTQLSSLLNKI